jgi:hypothetical protein
MNVRRFKIIILWRNVIYIKERMGFAVQMQILLNILLMSLNLKYFVVPVLVCHRYIGGCVTETP